MIAVLSFSENKGLPKKFCDSHLPIVDTTIALEDENGQLYQTKYLAKKIGLSGGWRGFSITHNLHQIFPLVQPSKFKGSNEMSGALGLLKLNDCTKQIDGVEVAIDHASTSQVAWVSRHLSFLNLPHQAELNPNEMYFVFVPITIPYPWLVFGEKVKVNAVFICDSTGVSDSILILFGGALSSGIQAGHLKMLDGYVDFFMDPNLVDWYLKFKEELDKLLEKKLEDPSIDIHKEGKYLMLVFQELVLGDQCEGRFVFGRESRKPRASNDEIEFTKDGTYPKSLLQTLLMRSGHSPPKYKTKLLKTNDFRALGEFKGMQYVGKPRRNKQLAEKDVAIKALAWLTHTSDNNQPEDDKSPPNVTDNMLIKNSIDKLANRQVD
ncbi:hypothetical protein RIF29_29489 [Crotalaria pallida]|uniref:RNA helicase C-terminal domain-containing protein n=1 Tax=Crotalaria pallida TaxID=3830 RepID=A0AAN9EEY4_CROPI